ncbi:MAG TPA: cystathionine gamma-lyase [Blastocatellia bacterium]|nr:cystathionine gamma-lyase [Blastocatellia bacterium]
MNDATRVIRAGLAPAAKGEEFLRGPVFAGAYHLEDDPEGSAFSYGRTNNPTWVGYENAISDLEHAAATVVFSSGIAAIAATLGVSLKPGDVVVMPSDGYYGSRVLANGFFSKFGVDVRFAPTSDDAQRELLKGARLLWLESPSNPGLDVCDIRLLAEAAHAEGALVAVDNSTPSPLGQKPLDLGADFNVSSDSKITTGHADLILGHVSVSDATWGGKLREWRARVGSAPGPMEVWLAHRSLATLDVRLRRQCGNALLIAEFLASRKDVHRLRYPGLPSDPAHEIASRQMKLFGPVVSFELASRKSAELFLRNCKLVYEATSFGGVHTTAERRARWGGDKISEGFIRLSVGCEDAQDLIHDFSEALDRAYSK